MKSNPSIFGDRMCLIGVATKDTQIQESHIIAERERERERELWVYLNPPLKHLFRYFLIDNIFVKL